MPFFITSRRRYYLISGAFVASSAFFVAFFDFSECFFAYFVPLLLAFLGFVLSFGVTSFFSVTASFFTVVPEVSCFMATAGVFSLVTDVDAAEEVADRECIPPANAVRLNATIVKRLIAMDKIRFFMILAFL